MDKAAEFGALWKAWWKILQPEWRGANDGNWPLVREGPEVREWAKLMKGGGNGFVLVLLSLSWWMMRERDETRKTVESSSAFEDVAWVLQQMVQVLRDRRKQNREGQGGQGGNDQGKEGGDENDDPNVRPTKR
jgi:hypothetical protein